MVSSRQDKTAALETDKGGEEQNKVNEIRHLMAIAGVEPQEIAKAMVDDGKAFSRAGMPKGEDNQRYGDDALSRQMKVGPQLVNAYRRMKAYEASGAEAGQDNLQADMKNLQAEN